MHSPISRLFSETLVSTSPITTELNDIAPGSEGMRRNSELKGCGPGPKQLRAGTQGTECVSSKRIHDSGSHSLRERFPRPMAQDATASLSCLTRNRENGSWQHPLAFRMPRLITPTFGFARCSAASLPFDVLVNGAATRKTKRRSNQARHS